MHTQHICVLICTYKRPEYLIRLLGKLENQKTENLFDYSMVIVDNDSAQSAKLPVARFKQQSGISIDYFIEPEQNIALARNKTIEKSKGDFLGMIDDDEFPCENWLLEHYKAIHKYAADGIMGPVIPRYEKTPPRWVLKSRFFHRNTPQSGARLGVKDTRTGNALIKRELFKESGHWFDPRNGSGGEDTFFFTKKIEEGYQFIWCNEAPVYETVPPVRWKPTFIMKKAILKGTIIYDALPNKFMIILKALVAVTAYTLLLPLLLIFGFHFFMVVLEKDCNHFGRLLAALGIYIVKKKYVTH